MKPDMAPKPEPFQVGKACRFMIAGASVHFVVSLEKKTGEIRPILPGDPENQGTGFSTTSWAGYTASHRASFSRVRNKTSLGWRIKLRSRPDQVSQFFLCRVER